MIIKVLCLIFTFLFLNLNGTGAEAFKDIHCVKSGYNDKVNYVYVDIYLVATLTGYKCYTGEELSIELNKQLNFQIYPDEFTVTYNHNTNKLTTSTLVTNFYYRVQTLTPASRFILGLPDPANTTVSGLILEHPNQVGFDEIKA